MTHGINETNAEAVANALNGEAWQSGGNIWLILVPKPNGSLIVISDEVVAEYSSRQAFDENHPSTTTILLM